MALIGRLNIKQKYMFEMGTLIFNVTMGGRGSPNGIFHMPLVTEMSTVATRQCHQLYVPLNHTCTEDRSLPVAGPTLWNSLPATLETHPHHAHLRK